jgi:GxxExxY protein
MGIKVNLLYEEITEKIIGAAMEVHNVLGSGFLEGVYEEALCIELARRGLEYKSQEELSIAYKDLILRHKYIADMIIEDKIIIEAKATSGFTEVDEAQLFNYLKATGKKVGLLINFGKPRLEWKRLICESYFQSHTNSHKKSSSAQSA